MRSTAYHSTKAPWGQKEASPVYVLWINWASGARWYAARGWTSGAITVLDRVVAWHHLQQQLGDDEPTGMSGKLSGPVPFVRVELRDDDRSLLALMRDANAQGTAARVYLAAYGQQPDYYKLFEGHIASQPQWVNGRLKLRLSAGEQTLSALVGNLAEQADFPNIYPDHEGRMLPICVGKPTRVRCVAVQHGGCGRLREDCSATDTTLYIEGFEKRRQRQELVTLQIGLERLTGRFKGSTFLVETRGGGVLASGNLTADTEMVHPSTLHVSSGDLGTVDNQWTGLMVKMSVPQTPPALNVGNPWQSYVAFGHLAHKKPTGKWGDCYRLIARYDATNEELFIAPSFTYEDSTPSDDDSGRALTPSGISYAGHIWLPPSGSSYEILTQALAHQKGEEVWEVTSGDTVYVAADHRSLNIRSIYAYGARKAVPVPQEAPWIDNSLQFGGGIIGILGEEGMSSEPPEADRRPDWIEVPKELYRVNVNDTTTFSGLGRALTTISFASPLPTLLGWAFEDVELYADVEGYVSGGVLIQNPITALRHILADFASTISLDTTKFNQAAWLVDWLKADFCLTEQWPAQKLAAEITWQARCRAIWRDGSLAVQFLRNRYTGHDDYAYGDIVEGSQVLEKRPMDGIVTELEYSLTHRGERKQFKVEDTRASAQFGRRGAGSIRDFWVYEREAHAQAVAQFHLNRMKHEGLRLRLRVPLNHARNELGDVLKVYAVDEVLYSYERMEVVGIHHRQGDAARGQPPEIELTLSSPYGTEAYWECPGDDVCLGCEVYCEVASDVLPCVVAADIGCDVFDITDGYTGWDLNGRSWITV